HDILSVAREPEDFLPAAILGPEARARRTIPILPFPYENYIPIVLRRPLFAPVLQSYSAATEALQRFYIKALERQRPVGLDVVYGLDSVAVWPVDGIQTISRLHSFSSTYTSILSSLRPRKILTDITFFSSENTRGRSFSEI